MFSRIAGSMVRVLNETGSVRQPEGIVLDAPFTNMLAAAYHSPQGKVSSSHSLFSRTSFTIVSQFNVSKIYPWAFLNYDPKNDLM